MAKAVIDAGCSAAIVAAVPSTDAGVSGTAAWALEQMAEHGPDAVMPLLEQVCCGVVFDRDAVHQSSTA